MATRADIRDAFMDELLSVSGTYDVTDENGTKLGDVTLDEDAIGLRDPGHTERFPAIVYHEDYRPVIYNGVGTGPNWTTYHADGSVDTEYWREYVEAQFIIDVRASNDVAKEPIYESLRATFGKYQFSPWDVTDFHTDTLEINVLDSTSSDTGDAENVIRGDQLEIRVTFYRNYPYSTDNIEQINQSFDADNDGTMDYTYTT